MIVKVENIEIRGHEVKESKSGKYAGKKYIVVRFEDETGKSHEIVDRDMENEPYYQRGTLGDIYAELDMGKNFTRFEVSRFVAREVSK